MGGTRVSITMSDPLVEYADDVTVLIGGESIQILQYIGLSLIRTSIYLNPRLSEPSII